jgi:hypothetical protein
MIVRRLVMVLSIVSCGSLALAAATFAAGGGLGSNKRGVSARLLTSPVNAACSAELARLDDPGTPANLDSVVVMGRNSDL